MTKQGWVREWTLGPVSFEIEWNPRAKQYGFYLSLDFRRI